MNIFNLVAKLTLDDTQYKQGIEQAKAANKQMADSTASMGVAAAAGWAAIGAAVVAVIKKIADAIKQTTEYADTVKNLAQLYSETTENVQALTYISEQSGKSAEWALRKAKASGKEYYEVLGLTEEQYAKMVEDAREMGLVLEDEVLNRVDAFGDGISQLKSQWTAVLTGLLAGDENAEANLQKFFDRVSAFIEKYAPTIVNFAIKLILQINYALARLGPELISSLMDTLLDAVLDRVLSFDWFTMGVNIAIKLAEGILNIIPKLINKLFGWAGVNVGEISLGTIPMSDSSVLDGSGDYEITERTSQELTIKVESNGVTANDKAVASSLEDLIDEKLGQMLGGI